MFLEEKLEKTLLENKERKKTMGFTLDLSIELFLTSVHQFHSCILGLNTSASISTNTLSGK